MRVCVLENLHEYTHIHKHRHAAACMSSSRLSVRHWLGLLTCFCFYRAVVTAVVALPLRCGKCILLTQNVVTLLFFHCAKTLAVLR